MWKCTSVRPPDRWMSSAENSIWPTATTWRVRNEPGLRKMKNSGTPANTAPSTAAVTISTLTLPTCAIRVCGAYHDATAMPASHCRASSTANMRSFRRARATRSPR